MGLQRVSTLFHILFQYTKSALRSEVATRTGTSPEHRKPQTALKGFIERHAGTNYLSG